MAVSSEELSLGGLAALGAIGSVCAVLLRSTQQNLNALDDLRREAAAATEKLRQELRHHDETILKLQGLCAEYRFAIARLETERDALQGIVEQLQIQMEAAPQKLKRKIKPEDVL